jgi:hypothetical protein
MPSIAKLLIKLPKKIKKIPKKLKKVPRKLLKTPKKVVRSLKKLYRYLLKIGSKLKILPLDDLSGKLFAATEVFLVVDFLLVAFYLIGVLMNRGGLVRFIDGIWPHFAIGTVLLGVVFAIAYKLDERGLIKATLARIGLLQRNRISPGVGAGLAGLVAAVVTAFLVGNNLFSPAAGLRWMFVSLEGMRTPLAIEQSLGVVLVVFLLAFVVTAVVAHRSIKRERENWVRTDFTILNVIEHDDGTKAVRIRNDSDDVVDFSKVKVRDSTGRYYTLDRNPLFRPGEANEIYLPKEFVLKRMEYEVPSTIRVKRMYEDEIVTSLYTRAGDIFLLEWEEDAEATAD